MEKRTEKRNERLWVQMRLSSPAELQTGQPCKSSWVQRGGVMVGAGGELGDEGGSKSEVGRII